MNRDDFKKLLDESLEPIKKDLSGVKDLQEKRVLPTVTVIETTIKAYGDMYKMNYPTAN